MLHHRFESSQVLRCWRSVGGRIGPGAVIGGTEGEEASWHVGKDDAPSIANATRSFRFEVSLEE
jgi:hypothetical protein